jgi:SAM-dependent methyltransferase
MYEIIRDFVKIISETLPVSDPIYEFGTRYSPGQEAVADLRPLFPGKEYIGCDMRAGCGVDRVLNLHSIDLSSETAGTVFAFDTLEHVEYPRKAVDEIYRILKPGGMIAISSVMKFPIHNYPNDYWRFTPEGFKSLLKNFNKVIVSAVGEENFPIFIVGVGFKGSAPSVWSFKRKLKQWQKFNTNMSEILQKSELKK